jgi:hypothetical protein
MYNGVILADYNSSAAFTAEQTTPALQNFVLIVKDFYRYIPKFVGISQPLTNLNYRGGR